MDYTNVAPQPRKTLPKALNPHILMDKITEFTKELKFETTENILNNPSDIVFMCWTKNNIKCRYTQKITPYGSERIYFFDHPPSCDMISGIYSIIGFEFLTVSIDHITIFRQENISKGWTYFPAHIPQMPFSIIRYTFKVALPLPPEEYPIEKESLDGCLDILHGTVILEKVMLQPEAKQKVQKILSEYYD